MTEVGKLYKRERLYKAKGFSVEKIKEMRNDSYTQGIIDRMRERMEKLLAEGEDQVSDLMWRALRSALPLCSAKNYLHDFWDNLFAYRKDGEYAISRSNLFAWLAQELCSRASHQASDRAKEEFLILLQYEGNCQLGYL